MTRRRLLLTALLAAGLGCGDDVTGPRLDDTLEISFADLPVLSANDGRIALWVYGASDTLAAGVIPADHAPGQPFRFSNPVADASGVFVTVEPRDDINPAPSASVLLHGRFSRGRATLSIEGAVTDGRRLEPDPGAHSLFTTSNNVELGYPSFENSGLWLFSVAPSRNVHGTREVKLTPLRAGWVYEGWIVRQTDPEIWISYGKFRPDELSLLTSRDDTGAGPFAGDEDFRNAGVEDVPGEEWTSDRIAGQLGVALPAGVTLPIQLDATDAEGAALWRHVITIEPAFDETEGPLEGNPFAVRPYANPIGAGGPGEPRVIRLIQSAPTATVVLVPN